jgi:hypothetical protein
VRPVEVLGSLREHAGEQNCLLAYWQVCDVSQDGSATRVEGMLVGRQHQKFRWRNEVLAMRCNLLNRLGNGRRLGGLNFFRFGPGRLTQGCLDLFGHQAIRAHFAIPEGMGFAETDVENSGEGASLINGQD